MLAALSRFVVECSSPVDLLITRLDEIADPAFHQMIDELCHCVGWTRDDRQNASLFYLLSSIGVENRGALQAKYLATDGILTTKVGKLPAGAVYDLCVELVRKAPGAPPMDDFVGKTVLALVTKCFHWPKAERKRRR